MTYDPFNVYKLSNLPAVAAKLSLALSKSYNLRHYYGWAGAECSEKFAMVLHPPKSVKSLVATATEAERMTR
jgi:hypothetical protein